MVKPSRDWSSGLNNQAATTIDYQFQDFWREWNTKVALNSNVFYSRWFYKGGFPTGTADTRQVIFLMAVI